MALSCKTNGCKTRGCKSFASQSPGSSGNRIYRQTVNYFLSHFDSTENWFETQSTNTILVIK